MIIVLTLAYIALLFLLKSLGVIRLNLAWKLSPVVWVLILLITLFIPMQWGAPIGPVGVFRNVIEIVPAVAGEVVDVPVTPLTDVKAGEILFQIDPTPFQQEVDRLKAAYVDAQQQPELLASSVQLAEAALLKTQAEQERAQRKLERTRTLRERDAVSEQAFEDDVRTAAVADRAVDEAQAQLSQSQLKQAALTEEGENTAVVQARELLARAEYDLEHTTVRAPTDGRVQQLALRPGARVTPMPLRAALVFVSAEEPRVSVGISQNQSRFVQPGQEAEVVLKYRPGMTLRAEVHNLAVVTSGGQVQTSGLVEDITDKQETAERYQVVLKLTDDRIDVNQLPGGAVGSAAIYTDRAKFTHVIRRVMIRMQAWMNYIF